MFISSRFFFSYVVNIIVTYIYRIRQRVSINNYKRVKCEENILLIKNSLDYRNLAGGFAQQLKNLNGYHVSEIKIGLGRFFECLEAGKNFNKSCVSCVFLPLLHWTTFPFFRADKMYCLLLLLVFSVRDIRWSLPMDKGQASLSEMVLVLAKEDR